MEKSKADQSPLAVSGLGGWLILVQIGLYMTILLFLLYTLVYTLPIFIGGSWEALTTKGTEFYHPLWAPVILFETFTNVMVFLFCIYILVMFYGKKSILPRLMIIFYSVSLLIALANYILLLQIPFAVELLDESMLRDVIQSIITCAIWIPYFLKSKRVKNTFIQ